MLVTSSTGDPGNPSPRSHPLPLSLSPDAPFAAAAPGARAHAGWRAHGGRFRLWPAAAAAAGWRRSPLALAPGSHRPQAGTAGRLGLAGPGQGLLWAETGPDRVPQRFGVLAGDGLWARGPAARAHTLGKGRLESDRGTEEHGDTVGQPGGPALPAAGGARPGHGALGVLPGPCPAPRLPPLREPSPRRGGLAC